MEWSAYEIQMTRLVAAYLAASLIGFVLTLWCMYFVIRAAIRDGIKESGLVESWSGIVARERRQSSDTLPPDFTAR